MTQHPSIASFLTGKSAHTQALFNHFINEFEKIGPIRLHATKTMIAIGAPENRIAWITQFGKNFIHIVFPFNEPYADNFCFQKIGQVPGTKQYNHHFRMLYVEDVNEEVLAFMQLALTGGS